MQNQHQKIRGYRDLSQEEIDLMNEIKAQGEVLRELCLKIEKYHHKQVEHVININDEDEQNRLSDAEVGRWRSLGKTALQEGIMYLVRSVAQPTTF